MDDVLRPVGLTTPQSSTLTAVRADPGLSNAALARAAFVTPQTMQAIKANLERERFLIRRADPAHGRILQTELTDRGRAVLESADALILSVEAAMVRSLTAIEEATLIDLLTRCVAGLSAAESPSPA